MTTGPRRLLFLYTAFLGLEIGGGTLQNTGLVTAIWLNPHRDIPFGLNSSFFFPLIGLAVLVSLVATAIAGRKSPREVKRPMFASFGCGLPLQGEVILFRQPRALPWADIKRTFGAGSRRATA